jgi:hypothetical protein
VLLGNHWCLFMLVNVDWRQLWHLVKNTIPDAPWQRLVHIHVG